VRAYSTEDAASDHGNGSAWAMHQLCQASSGSRIP
jgi:hypothetical protein